jgi:hypothetical protein
MVAPHFNNVDLDIESKYDLAALEAELGKRVVVLTGGPVSPGCFLLRLEIVPEQDNPDDTICALCSFLERLSAKGRRAWRSAHKKEFDVGFDAVRSQLASQFSLRTDTLKRMSNLGATLGVTFCYHLATDLNVRRIPLRPKGKGNKSKRQDPGHQP